MADERVRTWIATIFKGHKAEAAVIQLFDGMFFSYCFPSLHIFMPWNIQNDVLKAQMMVHTIKHEFFFFFFLWYLLFFLINY